MRSTSCAVIRKRKPAIKEQLESVVLQMYRAGVRCSEAVREFQKAFILAVLKDQRGNQCKAAEKLGVHRNTLRRTIRALEIDIGSDTCNGEAATTAIRGSNGVRAATGDVVTPQVPTLSPESACELKTPPALSTFGVQPTHRRLA